MKRSKEDFYWKQLDEELMADCHIFSVYRGDRVSPQGQRTDRYFLKSPNWVTIIALVEKEGVKHCLMVRQFRQGSNTVTYEFPAGMVDPGEDPDQAVARELLEETGYEANEIIRLGAVNPNSAFMNNTQFIYFTENPVYTSDQDLDEHEDVEAELVPLREVIEKMGTGDYSNGTMMTALGFYLRYQQNRD